MKTITSILTHQIEYDLMAKRAQLIFYTAWEIANREGRITADKL